jgi:hypothetical protein
VISPAGTSAPTGAVSFYDAITGTPILLGAGSLAVVSGNDVAALQSSFSVTGSHPITAVYAGDPAHTGITGSVVEIVGALSLTPATLTPAAVGTPNSEALSASGGDGPATYTYALTSGSLPAGLTLIASGVIGGTPTTAGSFGFTVTATDSGNSSLTGSRTYVLMVITPSVYTAPSTLVGSTLTNLTAYVNITAAGTSASTLGAAIKVLTQGATGLDFNFVTGGTCAASTAYTVGQVCSVIYSFSPLHPWARYGGIEVVSSTGAVLGNSFVYGTCNSPQAAFSLSTPTTPVTLGGGFHQPTGLALDASGNIYVADLNNNTVYEILAAGGYTTINTLGSGFNGPSTVAIDGSGNIYIANANDETVSEMPPGCASAACVVSLGGGFTRPQASRWTEAGMSMWPTTTTRQ